MLRDLTAEEVDAVYTRIEDAADVKHMPPGIDYEHGLSTVVAACLTTAFQLVLYARGQLISSIPPDVKSVMIEEMMTSAVDAMQAVHERHRAACKPDPPSATRQPFQD